MDFAGEVPLAEPAVSPASAPTRAVAYEGVGRDPHLPVDKAAEPLPFIIEEQNKVSW